MFSLFRSREKSQKVILSVLMGLVAVSMLIYLVPGGFGGGGGATGDNVVAKVGSQEITTDDVRKQLSNMSRGQQNLPKAFLGMFVPRIVDNLITSKAMAYKAQQMGIRVSDDEVSQAVQQEVTPYLGGKFTLEGYEALLQQNGLTVTGFEGDIRQGMMAARLEDIQNQAIVVTDSEARAEYARRNKKVALEYIAFTPKDFEAKVDKDPAKIKAYFDKNRGEFRTPEKRDILLVIGSVADFAKNVNVSNDTLHKMYQDEIDSFRTPDRVRARHILIKLPQNATPAQKEQAKAKAQDILNQLQHGGNFADLAKKYSDDPGSGAKGGELGWLTHGQTVANFDKTVFSLNPGQMSGLVETEYGYHIIQTEEKQAAHTMSFDEAKPQLLAEAQKQTGMDQLDRAMSAAREDIGRNPSQAEAIARKYNLEAFREDGYARGGPLPDIGSQPALGSAIFTTAKGGVTDITNMDQQGKEVFAVVDNITPARNAEFNEVQADVQQRYLSNESQQLANEAAKAAADRAKKGEALEAIAKSYGLQVKTAAPFTVDGAAEGIGAGSTLQAAFKANVGGTVGPVDAAGGEFVCQVTQSTPADMSQFTAAKDSIVQALKQQRQTIDGPLFADSVVTELKQRGKIKMNQDAISRLINSYTSAS